ncbi:MAG TPA: hypothetical protein VHE78_01115 [Gemmatimonadaceae bacterium]|nr:hypothetical protein [Gemmatimonadaceae bacterium]
MPVTAKLSKLFYDRLGEQVANELVEWFNVVDEDYRGQLRALNELNFARFDSKLEQRAAELNAKLDQRAAELNAKLDRGLAELRAELNAKIDRVHAELNTKIDSMGAQLTATLERRLGEQTRWFFVAWASLLIPIIGLWTRR